MCLSGDREVWNWGCSECRGPEFAEQDRYRKARNCDGDPKSPFAISLGRPWAPELRQCPWAQISDEVWDAIHLWSEWRRFQVLPHPGDLLDQDAEVSEVIMMCEDARVAAEDKRRMAAEHEHKNTMNKLAEDSKKRLKHG